MPTTSTVPSGGTTAQINNIFDNTLAPIPVTQFTLFRGVTDFTNLQQFDLYETGYSFLVLLKIPRFLEVLAEQNKSAGGSYEALIQNYRHILEYEFKGCQGIDDITSDTSPLSNGINELNVITKVNEQAGSNFQMNYFERSGSVITKVHELYLRGIKDPRTQVKRYNGLLVEPFTTRNGTVNVASTTSSTNTGNIVTQNLMQDKGYQYEVFHFLLIVTDNTALNVEKAYILASCQPSTANTSIYNVTRGEIGFSEMSLSFNGFPIPGRIVTKKAVEFLSYINAHTCFDEMEYGYNILKNTESGTAAAVETANSAGNEISSPTVNDIETANAAT